ncbi:hypothetical protein [Rhodopila sp.]|uniref:hypothetical protein n=1 Tax=Rhodopila sp. TaxID=2480087 RepID=UPI003D0EFAD6
MNAVRQQSRGKRVASVALIPATIEAEIHRSVAIDPAAFGCSKGLRHDTVMFNPCRGVDCVVIANSAPPGTRGNNDESIVMYGPSRVDKGRPRFSERW